MKSMPGSNANYKKSIRANNCCSFSFKVPHIHAYVVQTTATSARAIMPKRRVAHRHHALGNRRRRRCQKAVASIAGFQ
jgi:hypothetical protein